MSFSNNEIQEFITEAQELLDEAEKSLLAVEGGANFKQYYDAIFRAFHSIKGASGMLELNELQQHMHKLESLFGDFKNQTTIPPEASGFFLSGIDAARTCMLGKEFTFEYELKSSKKKEKVSPPPLKTSEKKFSSADPLIFIIDDEEMIVEMLIDLLTTAKYSCKGFTKASDLLQAIESEAPSVIISDINMPEMTGFELLATIKKIDKNLPVIFSSGFLSKENLIEAMSKGVYGIIEKPFKNTSVLQIVAEANESYKLWKILNKSIDLILFQLNDLGEFLKKNGKQDTFQIIKEELAQVIEARKKLKK